MGKFMLELNLKVPAKKLTGIVIILLIGGGIISFFEVVKMAYAHHKSASLKTLSSGLWGDIVTTDIMIDLPDEFVVPLQVRRAIVGFLQTILGA